MTKFVTKSNTHQQFCSFCSSHSRCIHADDVQVYRAGVEDLPHPYSAHQIGVMILRLHGQQRCSASVTVALTQQSRFFDCRAGATSLYHLSPGSHCSCWHHFGTIFLFNLKFGVPQPRNSWPSKIVFGILQNLVPATVCDGEAGSGCEHRISVGLMCTQA